MDTTFKILRYSPKTPHEKFNFLAILGIVIYADRILVLSFSSPMKATNFTNFRSCMANKRA